MKIKYNTPEIKVEELVRADVLCVSAGEQSAAPSPDNSGVTQVQWNGLSSFL